MDSQMLTDIYTPDAADSAESREPRSRLLAEVEARLLNAAVRVGPLINAVCSRYRDWIDLEHYRPRPRESAGLRERGLMNLTLSEDGGGLRDGGYIEIRILPDDQRVEADGGYFDAHHQPRQVIEGSVAWQELESGSLEQLIMLMHNRIVREYTSQFYSRIESTC